MGFRTVVVLSNDQAHEWQRDPELGNKIFRAASTQWCSGEEGKRRARNDLPYGEIVEQVHGDTQTLAVLDGYGGKAIAHTHWNRGQTDETRDLALLKELADKHGYVIRRKPSKKVKPANDIHPLDSPV